MWHWIEVVTVVLVVGLLGACTSTASSPDDAATCEDLVDLAVTVVVDARDSAANLDPEDLQGNVTGNAEAIFLMMVESMGAISVRSSELGCDSDEWNGEYQERVLQTIPMTLGGLYVLSLAVSSIVEPF